MSTDPIEELKTAVAKHLDLDVEHVWDYVLATAPLPADPVFGPRALVIVQSNSHVHVLRVMTSPLQNTFSVHEEATL